jgi:YVTN family beta-propeller protein
MRHRYALPLILFALSAHAHAGDYKVATHFAVGGAGGWDYPSLDAKSHRLYIARGDHVQIVDTTTGKEIASIPDTPGVHGVALAPELGRGYISCGKANAVKVFDLKTNAVTASVPAGEVPDAILYDPTTQRVFAFNGRSHDASVIDAKTNQSVATIALGGKPEFAREDGKGAVFVNIEDKSELVSIDAKNAKVKAHYPLPQCEEPTGLALDAKHRRSFSTCGNKKLVVLDIDSGKAVADVTIGEGPDGAEFDAASQTVFSANGEGSLSVIREVDANHYNAQSTLATQKSARTLALDPATHRLYLPAAEFGPPDAEHKRGVMLQDSFSVLVVEPAQAKP